MPSQAIYYSKNKKYILEVTPRNIESDLKLFEDKLQDHEPAGVREGEKHLPCTAELYTLDKEGRRQREWKIELLNEISPVYCIVSDSGSYVITFDDWYFMGCGENVIVIYGKNGKVVANYSLEDFLTDGEIQMVPESVSSRLWGQGHYLDEDKNHLVLRIVANGEDPYSHDALFKKKRIELTTGRLIIQN